MTTPSGCPDPAILAAWFDERSGAEQSPIGRHVAECPTCSATIASWTQLRSLTRVLPTVASSAPTLVLPRRRWGVSTFRFGVAAAAIITVILLLRPRDSDGLTSAVQDASATVHASTAELEAMGAGPNGAAIHDMALSQLRQDSLLILRVAQLVGEGQDD